MDKSPDAFRTISEVADWLGTPTHVLRFWESRFTQVKPVKRAGGRRYYRPADMALLGGIKKLLHEDGLTIRGVQKLLREEGVKHVSAMSPPLEPELCEAMEDETPVEAEVVALDTARDKPAADTPELPLEPVRADPPAARPDPEPHAADSAPDPETPPVPEPADPVEEPADPVLAAEAASPAPEAPAPPDAAAEAPAGTSPATDNPEDAAADDDRVLPPEPVDLVLSALRETGVPDPEALRPHYERLTALRQKMASDRAKTGAA